MFPTEPIVLLLDGLEHEGWGVHRLLDGRQLTVLLEVDAAVCAQQDVFSAPVVPVFGGYMRGGGECWKPSLSLGISEQRVLLWAPPDPESRERLKV